MTSVQGQILKMSLKLLNKSLEEKPMWMKWRKSQKKKLSQRRVAHLQLLLKEGFHTGGGIRITTQQKIQKMKVKVKPKAKYKRG
ncbi:hypothetical protein DPMN_025922 [Dreissena polymorpha]|uniref:Uncharacterized protein n=1 Tax=Dreissena polymorpha TaxID=45954 RepID=A0A9D4LSG7_DREPO|nr:hypothetical protein DPMN_025922 [Dreissena polymorpha]